MATNPDYVKFEGFPLALQIWFYECCNKVDVSIAIRTSNRTPRIFNWNISKNKIYFHHLKKGMFRKYGNQAENLSVLTDLTINKKRERDSYVRQKEKEQTQSVLRLNDKDLPHNSSHNVESDPSMTFNKDL
ncbi:hypothetical protein R3W88_019400 [Solanum pinnatisectum]|uniref:Uncharacterized protein n=1 Tax=Solanum pinnatisectum TaxID=50273 RepID=A0AAV9KK16_9SOLN|nr:hypothetical protein R3W88_019400 [Solanum pinnatisectum]